MPKWEYLELEYRNWDIRNIRNIRNTEEGMVANMDGSCLFCKIIDGSVPSKKVYENEWVLAFEDISPAARVHVLLVPKKHFSDILALDCGGRGEGAGACGGGASAGSGSSSNSGGNGAGACSGGASAGNCGGSDGGNRGLDGDSNGSRSSGGGGGNGTEACGDSGSGYGGDARYVIELHKAIKAVAELTGIAESGFRAIVNCGRDAGQTVPHLHCHILGGQPFGEALL
jgi:diadenosine tetraphosphate (Ap4A) HIT family hydrolase